MVRHGGYYYLFVSSGACCKGIGSSYQVLVGRSSQITGPYLDPNGTPMTDGGGMELLGSDEGMIGAGLAFGLCQRQCRPYRLPLLRRLGQR